MSAPGLRRVLHTRHLVTHGLAAMVPVSVWGMFGLIHERSHGAVPLVYLLGLGCMLLTACSYATMVRIVPAVGSVHAYASAALGARAGFVAGWMMLLDYVLLPTLLYAFAATSLSALVPGTPRWGWALALVALNAVISLAGIARTTRVLTVVIAVEAVFIGWFLLTGVKALLGDPSLLASSPRADLPDLPVLAGAVSIAVLSYLGFDAISTLVEETEDGRSRPVDPSCGSFSRDAGTVARRGLRSRRVTAAPARPGLAMVIALVLTGLLLIAQGWIAQVLSGPLLRDGALPPSTVDTAFFEIVGLLVSSRAMQAFLLVNVIAVGIANAVTAHSAAARLLLSMAREGRLPAALARIDRRGTPRAAVLLLAGLSAVLVLWFASRLSLITSLVNVGALIGYAIVHLSVIAIGWRRLPQPAGTRPALGRSDGRLRRPLLHAAVPGAGIVVLGYVLVHASPLALTVGGLWLALGTGLALSRVPSSAAR